jgi:hypothetical protein
MKTTRILGLLGVGVVAATLLSTAAEARPLCAWEGNAWHCWNSNRAEIKADRARLQAERKDVKRDQQRRRQLRAKLHHDMHYGSTAQVVHDVHKLQRTQNRLRRDRRDVHEARRELQRDRWGN